MISRSSITLVTLALLTALGCKKEATTPPDGEAVEADEADPVDEADATDEVEADEADEADAEAPTPLTKAGFDETIHDHFSEISDCYVAGLEGNPDLAGTINAEFTFDAEGAPTMAVGADSTLTDEGVVNCIAEASKGWEFGVPKEAGMKLNYPIKLEPAG